MVKRWIFILFIALFLAGCAPSLVQDRPIVFQASYTQLFQAVVELVVTTPVRQDYLLGWQNLSFEVEQADPRTGLIRAVREERSGYSSSTYFNGLYWVTVVQPPEMQRYVVQFVVRRETGGASLVYSTSSTSPNHTLPNRLAEMVLRRLEDRFKRL